MNGNALFFVLLVLAALAAVASAAWGRDRRQDPPDNSVPPQGAAGSDGPGSAHTDGPPFAEGHQFPGGDAETNLQAQEAGQLIAWCAQHPDTADQAHQLDTQLRALSTEWKETPEHLRAISKRRYYDWTSSILHDARKLAGLGPHGDPVVD